MKKGKKVLAGLLVLCLLLSISSPAFAAVTEQQLQSAVNGSTAYIQRTVKMPQFGAVGGEWAIIGLARSGVAVPQKYWDTYYTNVETYVKHKKGVLHTKKNTEYSRVVLALTAIGKKPSSVAGYNLMMPLGDFDKTVAQGINGPVWALLALDCGNYAMPVNQTASKKATRQMYINEILSRQLDDGGWNLTSKGGSGKADVDVTAMVLQALAAYQSQETVTKATKQALTCLSGLQQADGGFGSCLESTAQVQVALSALGIDQKDKRFVKQGHTVLDAVLQYRQTDGSFVHSAEEKGNGQMASEQGLYAMVAALRSMQGKPSLYDMDDAAEAEKNGRSVQQSRTGTK